MSAQSTLQPPLKDPATQSHRCLQHVEREEAVLSATLNALQQTRAALCGKNPKALIEALKRQDELALWGEDLRQHRLQFRTELAAELDVEADSVTLELLASRLPGEAGRQVARGRENLQRLAREVRDVNEKNAALVYHCLDFLDQFFADITGGNSTGGRYGRAGRPEDASCGSIIEARG